MSYQNQQIPSQQSPVVVAGQQQQSHGPSVNNFPNGPMYPAGLKQQYLPPQIKTNGLDNTRNVSSASLNQPLNAAHLPPTSSSIQGPNMYTSGAGVPNAINSKPPSFAPPILSQAVTQSKPSLAPTNSLSSQSTMNYYQTPPVAKSSVPMAPMVTIPNTQSVDKLTSNLQNMHLNNGNGIQRQTQPTQFNQIPGGYSPQITANRLTNGNTTQLQPSPTILGATNVPPKSITPNVAPPPFTSTFVGQANQIPLIPQHIQQQPTPQATPHFNGLPGSGPISNKYPPMNQQPVQPPQPQMQPQIQFKSATPVPNLASNSTIGKRPLYPTTQQQQQPPLMNNATNSAYNQYQQQPPTPQNYPQTMPPVPQNNQPYGQQQPQQPQYGNSVIQRGFDSMWGHNTVDLMQNRHILPTSPVEPPKITLEHQFYESVNCSPE